MVRMLGKILHSIIPLKELKIADRNTILQKKEFVKDKSQKK
jgi:hypothetical protein